MTLRVFQVLSPVAFVLLLFTSGGAQQKTAPEHNTLTQFSQALQRVVVRVKPAIVRIDVSAYVRPDEDDDGPASIRDRHRLTKGHALGSGVIVDPNGYILTNAHVIEGARILRVTLDDTLRPS